MLDVRVAAAIAAGPVDRTDVVDAMEDAGTVDLRGQEDLALLLAVLGPTAPAGADPRVQDMRDRLAAWLTTATHRRDRDRDGAYDDPQAPAIMDAWWPRLVHAMFDVSSGGALDHLHLGLDDGNRRNHIGSAFQGAVYAHVQKDLRQVLGRPVVDPWSRTYCGGGVPADCRAALWGALGQAAADLEAEFQDPDVADWRRAVADEDVRHVAVGVAGVPAIHWINRPTFQQVVQITKGACPSAPVPGCRVPASSGAALLGITDGAPDSRNRLVWRWQHGAATARADFGDPLTTTDYALCVYDGVDRLISHASAPAGGLCGAPRSRPCWRATATGYKYADKEGTPEGVQQLTLHAGATGEAAVGLKGKGSLLALPSLPAGPLPLTVQLGAGEVACWQASYATATRNDGERLKARSD
jgi:hypothetical protein